LRRRGEFGGVLSDAVDLCEDNEDGGVLVDVEILWV